MTAMDSHPTAPGRTTADFASGLRDMRPKVKPESVSYCSNAQPAPVGASFLSSTQQASAGASHSPTLLASTGVSYAPKTRQAPLAH